MQRENAVIAEQERALQAKIVQSLEVLKKKGSTNLEDDSLLLSSIEELLKVRECRADTQLQIQSVQSEKIKFENELLRQKTNLAPQNIILNTSLGFSKKN